MERYLALTENWIYTQLRFHTRYRPVVISVERTCQQLFPFDPILSLQDLPPFPKILQRAARKVTGSYPFQLHWLKHLHARVLQSHFANRGYWDLPLKRALRVPHVVRFYGYDVALDQEPSWKPRLLELFRASECFLVVGDAMKKRVEQLGCPTEKIVVLPLGIDIERIPFLPRTQAADEPAKILVVGRFSEKKGIPDAIEAFALAKKKTHIPLELTIAGESRGTPHEEAEKAKILRALDLHQLTRQVRILPFQSHEAFLRELLRHHILLFPSFTPSSGDTEGAPLNISEAQATGMPVISTLHADIPSIVIDGTTGFLVPERDIEGLSDRLAHLANHPEHWITFGKAGRQHVEEQFLASKQNEKLEALYDSLITRS